MPCAAETSEYRKSRMKKCSDNRSRPKSSNAASSLLFGFGIEDCRCAFANWLRARGVNGFIVRYPESLPQQRIMGGGVSRHGKKQPRRGLEASPAGSNCELG